MNGISGICGDQANSVSIVEKGNVQGPLKTQSLLIVVLAKLYITQKWIQEEWTTKEKYHVPIWFSQLTLFICSTDIKLSLYNFFMYWTFFIVHFYLTSISDRPLSRCHCQSVGWVRKFHALACLKTAPKKIHSTLA